VLWKLNQRGYTPDQLRELYQELSPVVIESALRLEQQLHQNALAA
jgi:hypothetical protein